MNFADALAAMNAATLNTSPEHVGLAIAAMQVAELQRLSDAVVLVADAIHSTALVTGGDGMLEPQLAMIGPAIEDLTRTIADAACRSRFAARKQ